METKKEIEFKKDILLNEKFYPKLTPKQFKHFLFWIEKAKADIIMREIKMQCLLCGKSLHREIMDKKIHIHLCEDCRLKEISKDGNL